MGDTVYSIARKRGIDVKTLIKRNNIKPPYLIHEGQILYLIEKKALKDSSLPTEMVKSPSLLTISKTVLPPISSVEKLKNYKVEAGDTLYSIAWNRELDVDTLIKCNNLKSPYLIYEGQILNLLEEKQVNSSLLHPEIVKNDLASQKTGKKKSFIITSQNNIKNSGEKVVDKKTTTYAGNLHKKKAVQKTVKARKISHWRWPAKGKLTERFLASKLGMKGISITNQRGTAIYATAPGRVVYAGNGLRGYGQLIIIGHNDGYLSAYAHNEKLLVHENEQIKEGQKIAIMGDSGTNSVHLYFEIRYRGKSVDPLRYLGKR